jgi:hypothetical protein
VKLPLWVRLTIELGFSVGFILLLAGSLVRGEVSVGFGVAVPAALPIAWQDSFSFLTGEFGAEENMALRLTVGTYPADFPDRYEADATLLVKAWLGPAVLYGGGGLSLEWKRIGDAWLWTPLMNIMCGVQFWLTGSVAVSLEARSLDKLPARWILSPELCLGTTLALGPIRPSQAGPDAYYLWVLVGLGVAALLVYYPRT